MFNPSVNDSTRKEITRLMFDPSVTDKELKNIFVKSGLIKTTVSTKAMAKARSKWDKLLDWFEALDLKRPTAVGTGPVMAGGQNGDE